MLVGWCPSLRPTLKQNPGGPRERISRVGIVSRLISGRVVWQGCGPEGKERREPRGQDPPGRVAVGADVGGEPEGQWGGRPPGRGLGGWACVFCCKKQRTVNVRNILELRFYELKIILMPYAG